MRNTVVAFVVVAHLVCFPYYKRADAQTAPGSSTVIGRVYDSSGKPAAGFQIFPFPLETGMSVSLPFSTSDEEGVYRLVLPPLGKTRICAKKEAQGYPDTTGSVFVSGEEKEPEIDVRANQTYENVDIKLPPPDGVVFGSVVDAVSGAAVKNIHIDLKRADDPSFYYSRGQVSSTFTFSLPPRPLTLSITAPGYLKWATTLNLANEDAAHGTEREKKQLTVALTPRSDEAGKKEAGK